jgi:hypothetical protein
VAIVAGRAFGAGKVNFITPTPTPSPTILRAPPPDLLQVAGAIIAIVLAIVAAVIGYRVIRGGRGL